MSFWRSLVWFWLVSRRLNLVSSANKWTILVILLSISLIKIINRIGPKTLPCGTPPRTSHQPKDLPLTRTFCRRWVRKLVSHFSMFPRMPYDWILARSPLVCTVSNVFAKSLAFSSTTRMTVISASSTYAEPLSLMISDSSLYNCRRHPGSRHFNRLYSMCCCLVENGCILVISASVFPFPPESSLSYIRMVVVPMGRCRLFVVVLVRPIVLMRVGGIPVSQWSIHSLLIVSCNGYFGFPLILAFLCVPRVTCAVRVSSAWHPHNKSHRLILGDL